MTRQKENRISTGTSKICEAISLHSCQGSVLFTHSVSIKQMAAMCQALFIKQKKTQFLNFDSIAPHKFCVKFFISALKISFDTSSFLPFESGRHLFVCAHHRQPYQLTSLTLLSPSLSYFATFLSCRL